MDLRLKLSSFILKNQPKKSKKDKAEKKARRAKAKENGDAETNGNGHASPDSSNSDNANADADGEDLALEAGSDDELTRRINAEAKDLNGTDDKDDKWTVDVSEEAVKARAQELPDDFKKVTLDDDEDGEGEGEGNGSSSYDQFGSWTISTAETKGGVKNVDNVEIYLKAKELGIETKHKTLTVLAQTVFDNDITAQIPIRASMLKKVRTALPRFSLSIRC